jgi:hypothetical protein
MIVIGIQRSVGVEVLLDVHDVIGADLLADGRRRDLGVPAVLQGRGQAVDVVRQHRSAGRGGRLIGRGDRSVGAVDGAATRDQDRHDSSNFASERNPLHGESSSGVER